jgi:hypothetical protein
MVVSSAQPSYRISCDGPGNPLSCFLVREDLTGRLSKLAAPPSPSQVAQACSADERDQSFEVKSPSLPYQMFEGYSRGTIACRPAILLLD